MGVIVKKSQITIRRASHDDAGIIADLGLRTFVDSFGADNLPENIEAYVESSFALDRIEDELRDLSSRFFLAIDGEKAVGYAKLREGAAPDCVIGSDPVELERIYVDRSVIASGVGSMLMKRCIAEGRRLNHTTLWLGVWDRNERAIRFYEKRGFVSVGSKDFVLGSDVQTDLVMSLALEEPGGARQLLSTKCSKSFASASDSAASDRDQLAGPAARARR